MARPNSVVSVVEINWVAPSSSALSVAWKVAPLPLTVADSVQPSKPG